MKLKVKYHTLETLCNLYDAVVEYQTFYVSEMQFDKEYKAVMNIIELLFIKLKKKLLTKKHDCKPFDLSLEYFQSYYLLNFISANISHVGGLREQNLMLSISSTIHQKL